MTRARRSAGLLLVAGSLLVPREARADDDTFGIVLGSTLGMMGVVANITFTAKSAIDVDTLTEPSQSWMIAQTAVSGASALALNGIGLGLAADDRREEGYELLTLPFAIWTGGLATFGGWSLAEPGETDVRDRFALSMLAGANLAFTTHAIGAHFDERPTPYYLAVPELALMAPESVLTAIQAANDESGRPAWIALSIWSGLLAVHAAANLIGRATSQPTDEVPTPVIEVAPPPPVDPYYIDPSGVPPSSLPPSPPPPSVSPPLVVPAPIPGGASVGPGFMMVGRF